MGPFSNLQHTHPGKDHRSRLPGILHHPNSTALLEPCGILVNTYKYMINNGKKKYKTYFMSHTNHLFTTHRSIQRSTYNHILSIQVHLSDGYITIALVLYALYAVRTAPPLTLLGLLHAWLSVSAVIQKPCDLSGSWERLFHGKITRLLFCHVLQQGFKLSCAITCPSYTHGQAWLTICLDINIYHYSSTCINNYCARTYSNLLSFYFPERIIL